jgi:hypothetical protein
MMISETIDAPIYDWLTYPREGVGALDFFNVPIGVDGKTYAETNMLGRVPPPEF